jgi:hypothetical protein
MVVEKVLGRYEAKVLLELFVHLTYLVGEKLGKRSSLECWTEVFEQAALGLTLNFVP